MRDRTPPYEPAAVAGSSDERAAAFVTAANDAMIAVDGAGHITLWNDAAERLFGHSAAAVVGRSLDVIIPEAMRGEHAAGMRRIVAGEGPRLIGKPVELLAVRADGATFPIEMRLSMWREPALGFGAVIRDISERRKMEDRLHSLAEFDQLTMLPNRSLYLRRLADACTAGGATPELAVMVADIDSFAELNDAYGHARGDDLLRGIAPILKGVAQRLCGDLATVARLGPNEFGFVLPRLVDPLAAVDAADLIRDAVRWIGEQADVSLTASVGVAIAPIHGLTAGRLLANADFAMRRAKQDRGDRALLFQPQQREAYKIRQTLEAELKRAWAEERFEVFFQPQVRLSDGFVLGAEALVRWRHPERGVLRPGAFMHVLKDVRLSEEVGDFVLDTACRQAADWSRRFGRRFRIGVNLFERQLMRRDQPERITAALQATGLAAHDLELEITETVMTGSDEGSIRRIRRLRDLGVGIAFDDYGTGYASLGLLKRYPVTRLKIDRSFVREITRDRHDAAIVDLVLNLGRRFGFGVIAEGIETADQAAHLAALGCNEAQGYLFGKPMTAADFERKLFEGADPRASSRVA